MCQIMLWNSLESVTVLHRKHNSIGYKSMHSMKSEKRRRETAKCYYFNNSVLLILVLQKYRELLNNIKMYVVIELTWY